MAKINIPKIIREIHLSEHAPEYEGAVIGVWVNPPSGMMHEFNRIRQELLKASGAIQALDRKEEAYADKLKAIGERMLAANDQLYTWYAAVWSAGSDTWSAEQVKELAEGAQESDPLLWSWLLQRTYDLIVDYRGDRRKK